MKLRSLSIPVGACVCDDTAWRADPVLHALPLREVVCQVVAALCPGGGLGAAYAAFDGDVVLDGTTPGGFIGEFELRDLVDLGDVLEELVFARKSAFGAGVRETSRAVVGFEV
jgi:hypothetical protein